MTPSDDETQFLLDRLGGGAKLAIEGLQKQLAKEQQRVLDLHRRASVAEDDRDRLIRKARELGLSLREIGELVGLSHGRIQQITR